MTLEELEFIIEASKSSRISQKRFYLYFYDFAFSICMRYSSNKEDAQEICHDGFIKVFSKINECRDLRSFKGWLRMIFINTALDHIRKQKKNLDYQSLEEELGLQASVGPNTLQNFSVEEKLNLVNRLPHAYKIAFNLYVIEGFSSVEIAKMLNIAEGTVRSNLSKAKQLLQKMILESEKVKNISNESV